MSLQQITVLGIYMLNKDYITEAFCVNKDKPELECNGKCHMKDVMEKNEEKKDFQFTGEMMIAVFYQDCLQELPVRSVSSHKHLDYFSELFDSYEGKMFQPPQA